MIYWIRLESGHTVACFEFGKHFGLWRLQLTAAELIPTSQPASLNVLRRVRWPLASQIPAPDVLGVLVGRDFIIRYRRTVGAAFSKA
jgi:hypothetical protein